MKEKGVARLYFGKDYFQVLGEQGDGAFAHFVYLVTLPGIGIEPVLFW